jgi:hypothetical protein
MGVFEVIPMVQDAPEERAGDGVGEIPGEPRAPANQGAVVELERVTLDDPHVRGSLAPQPKDESAVDLDRGDPLAPSGQERGDGESPRTNFQELIPGSGIDQIDEIVSGQVAKEVLTERARHGEDRTLMAVDG